MRICFQSTDVHGQKSPVQYVDPGNRALLQLPEHTIQVWLDQGGKPNRGSLVPLVGEEGKPESAIGVTDRALEFSSDLNDPRLDLFWAEPVSTGPKEVARQKEYDKQWGLIDAEFENSPPEAQDLSHLDEPKTLDTAEGHLPIVNPND